MKTILFVKHISIEGPGRWEPVFQSRGYAAQAIDLSCGDRLPADCRDFAAVVVLGGPMNVYEEETYPFLREENIFIKNILREKIPYLGICLGAQLLTKAAGFWVGRSPKEEIGFYKVRLTSKGKHDILFSRVPAELNVYQWHGDMCLAPADNVLAESEGCPVQAVKFGPAAYGLQFHAEITQKDITDWSDAYQQPNGLLLAKKAKMLQDYRQYAPELDRTLNAVAENFLQVMSAV
ncbi:MAG: type 1 glutamine amidotransferase [Candidatus Omnitrophica bacterium]|nr:type 1 glutamine amidotransferase [Candidatus Omnitrophota bacterium]